MSERTRIITSNKSATLRHERVKREIVLHAVEPNTAEYAVVWMVALLVVYTVNADVRPDLSLAHTDCHRQASIGAQAPLFSHFGNGPIRRQTEGLRTATCSNDRLTQTQFGPIVPADRVGRRAFDTPRCDFGKSVCTVLVKFRRSQPCRTSFTPESALAVALSDVPWALTKDSIGKCQRAFPAATFTVKVNSLIADNAPSWAFMPTSFAVEMVGVFVDRAARNTPVWHNEPLCMHYTTVKAA